MAEVALGLSLEKDGDREQVGAVSHRGRAPGTALPTPASPKLPRPLCPQPPATTCAIPLALIKPLINEQIGETAQKCRFASELEAPPIRITAISGLKEAEDILMSGRLFNRGESFPVGG